MRSEVILRSAAVMVFAALITASFANPYLEDEEGTDDLDDYDNNKLENFLQAQEKRNSRNYMPMRRSCIKRNGNCDHRPEDCCYNSTCRCNLWGSNCKCQRMGLFQKWGK